MIEIGLDLSCECGEIYMLNERKTKTKNSKREHERKKVWQKIFLGFTEGDWVYYIDGGFKKKVKVIKIFPKNSAFYNLAIIEFGNKKDLCGIKLLRPR